MYTYVVLMLLGALVAVGAAVLVAAGATAMRSERRRERDENVHVLPVMPSAHRRAA